MKRKGTMQTTPNRLILRIPHRSTATNAGTASSANDGVAVGISASINAGTTANISTVGSARTGANDVATTSTATRGSSLIWVMVVVLLMIIVLGIGLVAVSGRFTLSATRHEQQQAYYTALSSTDTLSAWIMKGSTDAERLLGTIPGPTDSPDNIVINTNGLPAEVGTCEVNLRFLDPEKTTLKIASTATFAGASETVSLTLTRNDDKLSFEGELKASDYSTAALDARADQLAGETSGGIVALYDADYTTKPNSTDIALLNNHITDANSTVEARWTNVSLTSSTTAYNNNVLGTQRYPYNGTINAVTDSRRFMVPINGRITIDPQEQSGLSASASKTGANNTKIVSLAIDGTAGKNVLLRLASGSSATSSTLLNKDSNQTFYDRSQSQWASLLLLNFTDNDTELDTVVYGIDGIRRAYEWHPNTWNKLDIFVQPNAEVTSNLVIGPFGHKYTNGMDYRSQGNFMDNWHGTTTGKFKFEWPYVPSTSGNSQRGLPIFAVDYGNNVGFWILDQRPDRYFRIMQGVNIMNGTIYSTRETIIGGALIRSENGRTTDGLNSSVAGFADEDPSQNATYVEATTRFTTFIYNTDIVLKAPSSGIANSKIRRPDTWQQRNDWDRVTDKEKEHFAPSTIIKGGTIYVGDRQKLTIEGSIARSNYYHDGDDMWIAPDEIVVAAGGSLTIERSDFFNIFTDIYVDGGTLTINAGAKIQGNIYAYNGATVDAKGNFWLNSSKSGLDAQAYDGLFIYGKDTIGTTVGTVTIDSAAYIIVPANLIAINGTWPDGVLSDGSSPSKVHLVGGDWADLVSENEESVEEAIYFLCGGYDTETGRCPHVPGHDDGSDGSWIKGVYDSG